DGKLVGAIGVSGVTAQQDGQIAKAGADALPKLLGREARGGSAAVRQCRRWRTSPTSSPGRGAATAPSRSATASTTTIITGPGAAGTPQPPRRSGGSTS